MTNEYKEGYEARMNDIPMEKCPYAEDPQKDEWEVGWLSGENQILQDEYFGDYWPGFEDVNEVE